MEATDKVLNFLYNEALENQTKLQKLSPDGNCPKCGGKLVLRQGRYGTFIGCSNYPTCRYTRN